LDRCNVPNCLRFRESLFAGPGGIDIRAFAGDQAAVRVGIGRGRRERRLRTGFFGFWLLFAMCLPSFGAGSGWRPVEKIETYGIAGSSGAGLYASIGDNGPEIGGGRRTLAHTTFTLTWTRKYEPQEDGACTLVSARPRLTIVYTLPKPAGRLPAAVAKSWEAFIAGVEAHERVHGDIIRTMVEEIEAVSVGLSAAGDPGCRKIRADLTARLAELSKEQRRKSRDFDIAEMADGGNMHRLILALVNGP
jgi:predicted secreted Zn-dependent protease